MRKSLEEPALVRSPRGTHRPVEQKREGAERNGALGQFKEKPEWQPGRGQAGKREIGKEVEHRSRTPYSRRFRGVRRLARGSLKAVEGSSWPIQKQYPWGKKTNFLAWTEAEEKKQSTNGSKSTTGYV